MIAADDDCLCVSVFLHVCLSVNSLAKRENNFFVFVHVEQRVAASSKIKL
jgi:hypothetical protein